MEAGTGTVSEPSRDVNAEGAAESALWALATSAGKDSTLALHRARAQGLDVRYAFNVYEGSTDRVRFHGTRRELVEAHGRALGVEVLLDHTHPDDFEPVFLGVLEALRERGVDGVIFGNVHLTGIREWYEERTTEAGLLHREPLWGGQPGAVVREFVELGFRATVVSVDLELGDPAWLGEEIDLDLIHSIEAHGADPCGEHGEYHTFVRDGPLFERPVSVRRGEEVEIEGHRLLDLILDE